jgi:hypothetical protein
VSRAFSTDGSGDSLFIPIPKKSMAFPDFPVAFLLPVLLFTGRITSTNRDEEHAFGPQDRNTDGKEDSKDKENW